MAADVGEALLDDPEDLDLLVGAELDVALDLEVDVQVSVRGQETDVPVESASTAKRASCWAAAAASWRRGMT